MVATLITTEKTIVLKSRERYYDSEICDLIYDIYKDASVITLLNCIKDEIGIYHYVVAVRVLENPDDFNTKYKMFLKEK